MHFKPNTNSIYIHIPFCIKKCNYCDFYSVTNCSKQDEYVETLFIEIEKQSNFFEPNNIVSTIYFGGGTPSLIEPQKLEMLISKIRSTFKVEKDIEITIEINPDDVNPFFIEELVKTSINRLSIGLQSTYDDILKILGRRHNALQSFNAIKSFQKMGYNNISIDLIYGIPDLTLKMWCNTINKAIELGCQHISAYDLTIEKGTPLYSLQEDGKFIKPYDDIIFEEYKTLVNTLTNTGFQQYEISNFSLPNYQSKHNSNYWTGNSYLGIGAAAHSYKKPYRFFNTNNIDKYISCMKNDMVCHEKEKLNNDDMFNEYILTSLRTTKGIDLHYIKTNFENYYNHTIKAIKKFEISKNATLTENSFTLTIEGFWVSNYIISELFV